MSILTILCMLSLSPLVAGRRLTAKAHATSSCPELVLRNTKGDCVDADATQNTPAPDCCDALDKCVARAAELGHLYHGELGTFMSCGVTKEDVALDRVSGAVRVVDNAHICAPQCVVGDMPDPTGFEVECGKVAPREVLRVQNLARFVFALHQAHDDCGKPSPDTPPEKEIPADLDTLCGVDKTYGRDLQGKCRTDTNHNGILDRFAKDVCCQCAPDQSYGWDKNGRCRTDINGNGILDRFANMMCCECNPFQQFQEDKEGKCRTDIDSNGVFDRFAPSQCCSS